VGEFVGDGPQRHDGDESRHEARRELDTEQFEEVPFCHVPASGDAVARVYLENREGETDDAQFGTDTKSGDDAEDAPFDDDSQSGILS